MLAHLPQGLHEVVDDGGHDGVEKVGCEVVDAQFERPEALANKIRPSLQCEHKWSHEEMQVWQEGAQADGHREAQFLFRQCED